MSEVSCGRNYHQPCAIAACSLIVGVVYIIRDDIVIVLRPHNQNGHLLWSPKCYASDQEFWSAQLRCKIFSAWVPRRWCIYDEKRYRTENKRLLVHSHNGWPGNYARFNDVLHLCPVYTLKTIARQRDKYGRTLIQLCVYYTLQNI